MPPFKRQPVKLEDLLAPRGLQTAIKEICQCVDEARADRESGVTLARRIAGQFVRWNREVFGPVPPIRTLRRINAMVKAQVIANYSSSAFERMVGVTGSEEDFDNLIHQTSRQRPHTSAIKVLQKDDSLDSQRDTLRISDSDDIH
ncbi:Hypothetical protein DHA2_150049 [Giardia duodenalis]|uniref:Uncharacterized protein n=1 Tax=Giardia intestinalis TaxID=5741 RepID=V6TJ05_GIAIN|nr:Hypothetical protein DHA2_150049 [Giardia intestinalis]